MDYRRMSSVESDFADHRGDGPPGAFIVWLIPIFWPFIILRLLLAGLETSHSPQTPKGPPPAKASRASAHQQTRRNDGGVDPYGSSLAV